MLIETKQILPEPKILYGWKTIAALLNTVFKSVKHFFRKKSTQPQNRLVIENN